MNEGRRAAKLNLEEEIIGIDEDLHEYADVREKVLARLHKMGFEPAPMPTRNGKPLLPEMPDNPASLSNKEITNKRGEIVAIFSYAIEIMSLARITAEAYSEQAKHVRSVAYRNAKGTAEERKAKAQSNIEFKRLNGKRLEWMGIADFLEARCDTLDKCDKILSRDVEFRVREFDQYRRDGNVNRIRERMDRSLNADVTFTGDDS